MIYVMSGGASLNYKVVNGTAEPTSPKENTIWVNTATAIHAHAFSADEPHRVSKNKNLVIYPYYDKTYTGAGITWTDNGDGTVTANGTAGAPYSLFRLSAKGVNDKEMLLEPGTYTFSAGAAASTDYYIQIAYTTDDWATTKWVDANNLTSKTFTITQQVKARINLKINEGATVSNLVFKPQLEKGSSATDFVKGDATGQVWFQTGTDSANPFSALKKTKLMVYIIGTKVYDGSAWVTRSTKIYQGGAWKAFDVYLFNYGDLGISGGFIGRKSDGSTESTYFSVGTSIKSQTMQYTAQGYFSVNKIDLAPFSTVKVTGYGGWSPRVGFCTEQSQGYGTGDFVAYKTLSDAQSTVSIDVSSLTGSYYFCAWHFLGSSGGGSPSEVFCIELIP